jgi:hypothetical protein
MEQLQSGKKRIAIISDAAAMGISLHASNRAENRQRRVHVTLELGWSADKQLQTFGRTHRSDQAVPPEYVLLSTELGGEKRFSSTIARRLGSLGALTKGDRRSADSGDLAKYNFETQEGRAALCLMLRRIVDGRNVSGLANPRQTLRDIGLLVRNRDGVEEVRKDDLYNVPRFLNRVLALNVEDQNALFDHFADLFDQTVRYAKANGTFDEGVTDIKALAIRIAKPPRVVHTDEITQAQTTHYTLEIDVPSAAVSFDEAERVRKRRNGAFFRHRKSGQFILAVESGLHTNAETGNSYRSFAVWKPEAARSSYIHSDELTEKYTAVTPANARNWWNDKYASVPPIETHEIHIIGGAIIPLWQRFKTHEEARLRVVRVTTDDGQRIVGIRIPREQVGPIVRALGAGRDLREPADIFSGILDEGEEVTLVSGLKLCRRTLHREPVIELIGVDPYKFAEIRSLGLLNEQIDWKQRFFVPIDEESGVRVISALLDRYPILITSESDNVEVAESEIPELRATQVVDLDEWFVAVEGLPSHTPEPVEELPIYVSEPPNGPEFIFTAPLTNSLSISQSDASEMQLAFDF